MWKVLILLCATHQPICLNGSEKPIVWYAEETKCQDVMQTRLDDLLETWKVALPHDPVKIDQARCIKYESRSARI